MTVKLIVVLALLYALWRITRRGPQALTVGEARALLDVPAGASHAEIAAAHRRLIARVHPDAGGTAALAQRINAARDLLLAQP